MGGTKARLCDALQAAEALDRNKRRPPYTVD